jgi:hypothetical protein
MMGDEDVRKAPAAAVELGPDRPHLGRVDEAVSPGRLGVERKA